MQKLKGILILLAGILLGKTRYDRHMCREMVRLAIIGWFRPYRISYVACCVGEKPIVSRQGIPTNESLMGHMELIKEADNIPSEGMLIDLPINCDQGSVWTFEADVVKFGRLIDDRENWGIYDAIVICSPRMTGYKTRRNEAGLKLLQMADKKNGGEWIIWWKKSSAGKKHPITEQEIKEAIEIACSSHAS